MGLFHKKKDAEATEEFFQETFGLTRMPGVGFQVQRPSDMTAEIRDPEAAVRLVKDGQEKKGFDFRFVCVLPAARQTTVVLGSKPPLAVVTALDAKEGADLIARLQKECGCKIVELEGAYILTLA